MNVVLNGQPKELPDPVATVEDLVRHLGLDRQPVAVELNRKLVRKAERAASPLRSGDAVEIVTLVGGG